jgi:SRSO17 transposase
MNLRSVERSKSRFAAYVEGLVSVIGHADRASPLRDYCLGLIMPCERKSVEPMAAITAPDRTAAQHQSLLHFVGQSPWSNEKVLAKVGEMVLPAIERHGPIEAWIIDDTGFPKKGQHSVGVARQYCGQLGKQDNCQVAVSLSLSNHHASLPVAWRLYLPKEWAVDHERRRKAGIPDEIDFKTKPEIALEQIEAALKAGLSRGVVLMDAGYGCNTNLRTGISALALTYVAGILRTPQCGRPARDRCRRRNGRAAANDRSAFAATTSINRSRSKSSLSASPSAPGAELNGGRGRPSRCRRALLACGFVSHIEITHARKAGPKSGY